MGAKLGQHFLVHSWAARALAHAVEPQPGETILEIGPGKGILTKELLKLGAVVAIEKDHSLVTLLKNTFATELETGRLRIVEGDVRDVTLTIEPAKTASYKGGDHDGSMHTMSVVLKLREEVTTIRLPGGYVVAANIPYYITGEIIRQFLTAEAQPRALALLIQKEVAQRITDTKESILSLSVKAYGTPRITDKVSKKHFSPAPKVDSAVIHIANVSKKFFVDISESNFFRVVHAGFASKRKFVSNNLAVAYGKEQALSALRIAAISEKARAEDLHKEQWKEIAKILGG